MNVASIVDEVRELHPLLRQLFHKWPDIVAVEYTHGSNEKGADFVLSRYDNTLDEIHYVGIIAKTTKIVSNTDDIERQIRECELERYFDGGKKKVLINEILVITTQTISINAQEKIHSQYKTRKISFLNGTKLEALLAKHAPELLSGVAPGLATYLASTRARLREIDSSTALLPDMSDVTIEQEIFRTKSAYGKKAKAKKSEPIDLAQTTTVSRITFLQGDMGSGKSRTLRRIAQELCDSKVFASDAGNTVPVLLHYDAIHQQTKSAPELLRAHLGAEVYSEALERRSRFLFIVDGVDEVKSDSAAHLAELQRISAMLLADPAVNVIFGSRFLGFMENNTLSVEHETTMAELRPLSIGKVIAFIQQLCKKTHVSNRLFEDLKKSPLMKKIPTNPIAAILLAQLINENERDLPSNLPELYSKYVEIALGRWDVEKGLRSQKQYEAISQVLRRVAEEMLTKQRFEITRAEALAYFSEYLSQRNLDLDASELFEEALRRCELITLNNQTGGVIFRHRTFAEFLFAQRLNSSANLVIPKRAFDVYWANTYYFLVGLRRDCPELLAQITDLEGLSDGQRIVRAINGGQLLLAAFTSPYASIEDFLRKIIVDAARLYVGVRAQKLEGEFQDTLSDLSPMNLIWIFQAVMRESYSYEFLRKAIVNVAYEVSMDGSLSAPVQSTALFFLCVAYADTKGDDSMDPVLLKLRELTLPDDIRLALSHEFTNAKVKSGLMRQIDKKTRKLLGTPTVRSRVERLYDKTVKQLAAIKKAS